MFFVCCGLPVEESIQKTRASITWRSVDFSPRMASTIEVEVVVILTLSLNSNDMQTSEFQEKITSKVETCKSISDVAVIIPLCSHLESTPGHCASSDDEPTQSAAMQQLATPEGLGEPGWMWTSGLCKERSVLLDRNSISPVLGRTAQYSIRVCKSGDISGVGDFG